MARNLNEMLEARSPESRRHIAAMATELQLEIKLHAIREALELSQAELGREMGISQPSVVAIEQRGAQIKLSTMKRYIEAMGGKLRIDVELPTGRHITIQM